ncbi:MAG: hypothetical protein ACJAS9_003246 [Polaribacter sp.]|jgi:hypothetical protein
MKLNKLVAGLCVVLAAPSAFADPIYIDVGVDFGGNTNTAAGATTTGLIDELTYIYESNSVVTTTNDALINAGDAISTSGGLDLTSEATLNSSFGTNAVTGFNPVQGLSGPSNNNHGVSWFLSFAITDLMGTLGAGTEINGVPPDNLEINYTSGSITFYYLEDNDSSTNFQLSEVKELFTIDVASSTQDLTGSHVFGNVTSFGAGTVNGIAAADVFNFADVSFGDKLISLIEVKSSIDFNTDNPVAIPGPGGNQFTFEGIHDGSIKFIVPEPASLSVFALGLLGLAGFARRQKTL